MIGNANCMLMINNEKTRSIIEQAARQTLFRALFFNEGFSWNCLSFHAGCLHRYFNLYKSEIKLYDRPELIFIL